MTRKIERYRVQKEWLENATVTKNKALSTLRSELDITESDLRRIESTEDTILESGDKAAYSKLIEKKKFLNDKLAELNDKHNSYITGAAFDATEFCASVCEEYKSIDKELTDKARVILLELMKVCEEMQTAQDDAISLMRSWQGSVSKLTPEETLQYDCSAVSPFASPLPFLLRELRYKSQAAQKVTKIIANIPS